MGTRLASSLISQVSEIIQDESNIILEKSQALSWLNNAQLAVTMIRPDASISNHSIKLAAGTKQAVTGLRLMAVVRNMGTDGLTPGRAIRLVERGVKDEFEPDWHTETASGVVREYVYDARLPKEFYVSPPVHSTTDVHVEVSEVVIPNDVALISDTITLDDSYIPAMIEWMLYRFFSRDSEESPSIQSAVTHFQNFFTILGAKLDKDMAFNPKIRAQLS